MKFRPFRFLFQSVAVCFLILTARRRRLQKLRNRVESLRVALRMKTAEAEYSREQLEGYRDAFQAIQIGYQALGAANLADRDRLVKPNQ